MFAWRDFVPPQHFEPGETTTMMRVGIACLISGAFGFGPLPAQAESAAARYLVSQQVAKTCPKGGQFKPAGIMERDLTGDGRPDLVLNLAELSCRGAANGTNDECGAAHCPVLFFVRQGDLLVLKEEIASIGARIGSGAVPRITLVSFEYKEHTVRWDGSAFR
ncbi:hypothetical protein [Methylobacterium marchantiae]|uniref:Uncharacterized protein n=1 Tax=Methylobacterium marchantiae TaxID=600331 RepID=A0ABW3WWT2_9HYPH|nr:hypothetical protein AIGOOFII_1124 [Methylobacterium marchantiae]